MHRIGKNYLGGGTFNLKKPFEVSDVIHDTTDWGTHLDVVDSKMYDHHMGLRPLDSVSESLLPKRSVLLLSILSKRTRC